MKIREYAEKVLKSLDIEGAEIKEVEKANGVVFTGIMVPTGNNVAVNIYVNEMMEDGLTPKEAATEVLRLYKRNKKTEINVDFIQNYEEVKPHLRARLYNEKTNAEVKRSAAKYGFDDLIIVPYIELGKIDNNGNGGIKVTNELLSKWDKTATEVINAALENTKGEGKIKSMAEILAEMMPEGIEMPPLDQPPMNVVTNSKRMFGAIHICLEKEKLKEMFPKGYIVLPSSVHEVIVISKEGADKGFLDSMVNDVNDAEVAVEEQLGTKAYIF